MFVLPYETTICRIHSVERLTLALKRANIEFPFPALTTPSGNVLANACFVTPRPDHQDAPPLTQFLDIGEKGATKLVVDARQYMRYDNRNDTYRLTAENDYSFLCTRVALTQVLMREGTAPFRRLGDIPAKVFSRWVTASLARRYNLPMEHSIALSVICTYYYFGLLNPEAMAQEDERIALAPIVSRISGVPARTVLDYAARITSPAANADDLAQQIAQLSGSLRFGEFKFVDLFTMLAPSWIGINARETVGVALEHVPTLVAMIYAALAERSYRKTPFTQRVEGAGRRSDMEQFVTQVNRMVRDEFTG